ncbi:hypothetical protein MJH12_16880, partial [bacterium]|nr:hypothetical protein [bacterium]
MSKSIVRSGLLSLFCVSKLFSVEFIFIEPNLIDLERKAFARNIQKVEVDGQVVFSYSESKTEINESIKNQLKNSKLIEYVGELSKRARTLHLEHYGDFATVDEPNTPIFTYLGSRMGTGGPAVTPRRIQLQDSLLRSDSLLILADIKRRQGAVTLQDFIDQKYFSAVVVHELFHGIMGDIYGQKIFEMKARSLSRVGHAAQKITDPFLAYMEGMAEAMELAAQEMFPKEISAKVVNGENLDQFKLN